MKFVQKVVNRYKKMFQQRDKQLHLIAGYVIGFVFSVVFGFLAGLGVGVIIGGLKEFYDSRGHGTVEFQDFECTCYGALIGASCGLVLRMLIREPIYG